MLRHLTAFKDDDEEDYSPPRPGGYARQDLIFRILFGTVIGFVFLLWLIL
jgi:hypothetical protein